MESIYYVYKCIEYIVANMNTRFGNKMKILVLEINNLHIQIVLEETFKTIVLAPFVQMIYNIYDMRFS